METAMALNLKNAEVEALVARVSALTGENKTQAIRQALEERLERLSLRAGPGARAVRLTRFLEGEVWPRVPPGEMGRRLSRDEEEAILGFGEAGA